MRFSLYGVISLCAALVGCGDDSGESNAGAGGTAGMQVSGQGGESGEGGEGGQGGGGGTGPSNMQGGSGATTAPPVCGNGMQESGEGCDDDNDASGDGCDDCRPEPGFVCSAAGCVFPRSALDGTQELRDLSENAVSSVCGYIEARLFEERFARDMPAASPSALSGLTTSTCEIADPNAWLACSTPESAFEDCLIAAATENISADPYELAAIVTQRCNSARLCECEPGTQACYALSAGPGTLGGIFAPEADGRYFGQCNDEGLFVPELSRDCDAEASTCNDTTGCGHYKEFGEGITWPASASGSGAYDLYYMTTDQVLAAFSIGLQGASQETVSVVVWEAMDEGGPYTEVYRDSQTFGFDVESISSAPNEPLLQGRYYAIGVQWGAEASVSAASSPIVQESFPFGYWLRSLAGSVPGSATAQPELRLRSSFTMFDLVGETFACEALRGRCAVSELDDEAELRTLSASQWPAFCERLPAVDPDSVGIPCDEGLFLELGDTPAKRCFAYRGLDWSTCAMTVGEATQCWTEAADVCTDYVTCMPESCAAAPRLQ